MAGSYVTFTNLRVGLPVEYLGDDEPVVVLSDHLKAIGLVLYSGHPGRVWSTLHQHVQVTWAGLEDEPATYALGFSVPGEEDTFYPALGLLTEEEFGARSRTASRAGSSCPDGFRPGGRVADRSGSSRAGTQCRRSSRPGRLPVARLCTPPGTTAGCRDGRLPQASRRPRRRRRGSPGRPTEIGR